MKQLEGTVLENLECRSSLPGFPSQAPQQTPGWEDAAATQRLPPPCLSAALP